MFATVAFFPSLLPNPDVTAPVIDSAVWTNSTQTLDVTVTEASGVVDFYIVSVNSASGDPSIAQIKAGTGAGILEGYDAQNTSGLVGQDEGFTSTSEAADEIHIYAEDNFGNESSITIVAGVTIDATLPTADSAATDPEGNTITITTSETVSGTPATGDFSFSGITAGTPTIDSVTVSGTSIAIEISGNLVATGDTVTVSYTKGASAITDAFNNEMATFASLAVTNNVPSGGPWSITPGDAEATINTSPTAPSAPTAVAGDGEADLTA